MREGTIRAVKPAMAALALLCALAAQAQKGEITQATAPKDLVVEFERKGSSQSKRLVAQELADSALDLAEKEASRALDVLKTRVQVLQDGPDERAGGESLIISHTARDPEAQKALEEDLAIMSRILGNVAEELGGGSGGPGPQWRAMGIPVFHGHGGSGPKNIYIEGHGVVFLLDINLPLKPSQTSSKVMAKDGAGRDEWEKARKELFGGERQGRKLRFTPPTPPAGMTWFGRGDGEAMEYDAHKVEKLRGGLLEALKNASNIRGLSPNDTITVALRGPVASVRERVEEKEGGKTVEQDVLITTGATQKVSMVISVNQGLAMSFAEGKASLEDLKAGAKITIH